MATSEIFYHNFNKLFPAFLWLMNIVLQKLVFLSHYQEVSIFILIMNPTFLAAFAEIVLNVRNLYETGAFVSGMSSEEKIFKL